MAPKKKKGLQKPQRGFATVSIPKKVAAEDAAAPEPATAPQPSVVPPASSNGHVAARSREPSAPPEQNSSAGQANAVDSWEDDSERTRLQQLVEPVRSAAEKESARTLKTIEFERRLAKSYSRFELDSKDERDLAGRVLALAREEDSSAAITAAEADVRALQRVATLDSILTQLGFSRERIQECMLAARSLEQRDVFDWLFVHADEDELACAGQAASQPTTNGTSTPAPQSEPPSQAPSEPPSAPASEPPSTSASAAPSEDESSSSEDEDEEPNERYARLKLAHSELQRDLGKRRRAAAKAKTGEDATIKKMSLKAERLEKRIASVERDYLFGKQVAERLFRERRAKLDAQQLAARLNRPPSPPPPPAPVAESPERPEESAEPAEPAAGAVEPQPATTNADVEGNDSDEDQSALFGEMFGEAGEAANGDATEDTTIAVRRDMALPRHFSGKTPRSLLEDAARKLDRYAHCSFTVISRSRAVRAKLAIRWDTSKGPPSSLTRVRTEGSTTTFEMTDVACEDAAQAYNFVATLALFEVAGGPKSQSVKQLPGAYRELWDELTVERQAQVDGEYRERIRGWQEILEKRGDSQPVEKKVSTPVRHALRADRMCRRPSRSATSRTACRRRRRRARPQDRLQRPFSRSWQTSNRRRHTPRCAPSATTCRSQPTARRSWARSRTRNAWSFVARLAAASRRRSRASSSSTSLQPGGLSRSSAQSHAESRPFHSHSVCLPSLASILALAGQGRASWATRSASTRTSILARDWSTPPRAQSCACLKARVRSPTQRTSSLTRCTSARSRATFSSSSCARSSRPARTSRSSSCRPRSTPKSSRHTWVAARSCKCPAARSPSRRTFSRTRSSSQATTSTASQTRPTSIAGSAVRVRSRMRHRHSTTTTRRPTAQATSTQTTPRRRERRSRAWTRSRSTLT